jgi:hypothetical protein
MQLVKNQSLIQAREIVPWLELVNRTGSRIIKCRRFVHLRKRVSRERRSVEKSRIKLNGVKVLRPRPVPLIIKEKRLYFSVDENLQFAKFEKEARIHRDLRRHRGDQP